MVHFLAVFALLGVCLVAEPMSIRFWIAMLWLGLLVAGVSAAAVFKLHRSNMETTISGNYLDSSRDLLLRVRAPAK